MCGIGLILSEEQQLEWSGAVSEALVARGPDVPHGQCSFGALHNGSLKLDWSLDLHASVLHMRGTLQEGSRCGCCPQPLLFAIMNDEDVKQTNGMNFVNHDHDDFYEELHHQIINSQLQSQPNQILNSDGYCAFCWNGECYAYQNELGLKIDLGSKGVHLNTDTVSYATITELVAKTNNINKKSITLSVPTEAIEERSRENDTTHWKDSDTILVKNLLLHAILQCRQNTAPNGGTSSTWCQNDARCNNRSCSNSNSNNEGNDCNLEHEAIAQALGKIHGEYAFLLFVPSSLQNDTSPSGYIYYGRDFLGRRSLLINTSFPGIISLSSVAITLPHKSHPFNTERHLTFDSMWEEISPGIVYRMNVSTRKVTVQPIPKVVNKDIQVLLATIVPSPLTGVIGPNKEESRDNAAKGLLLLLDRAIQRRVMHAPMPKSKLSSDASIAVLFSGGIDSVVVAALAHRHVPQSEPIDLINVSFYDESDALTIPTMVTSPDRLAAIHSYREMMTKWSNRQWRFIAVDVSYQEVLSMEAHVLRLIRPLQSTMDFNIGTAFWFAGRGRGRIVTRREADSIAMLVGQEETRPNEPKLFSQVPLLRFAKQGSSSSNFQEIIYNVETSSGLIVPTDNPTALISDMETNISAKRSSCVRHGCNRPTAVNGCVFNACKFCCGKLQSPISKFLGRNAQLCPAHNFSNTRGKQRSRNSPFVQSVASRDENTIIPPCKVAIHYSNTCDNSTQGDLADTYLSQAKVLLSGVGADEQMAGYGRHRTKYCHGGYWELKKELEMEVRRLWTRNLGRDDRCLSDFGKEARFPYLDEDVVAYLSGLPLELICDMTLPQGQGDKLILRKVARMVGVEECSTLWKRAIQFGSHIAKVSEKNKFGSHRRAKGGAKHVQTHDSH